MRRMIARTWPVFLAIGLPVAAWGDDFERPPAEPAAASVAPSLVTGTDYHLQEPVESDGLMHHYVVASRFGEFPAYGSEVLTVRLGEVAALTALSRMTDVDVIVKSVGRGVKNDLETVEQVVRNPVKTVVGIPKGVSHLFGGARAQAEEVGGTLKKSAAGLHAGGDGPPASGVASSAKKNALKYADRYLGVSKAERRYYAELKVDPSTDNVVLRRAISRVAKVDAATSLGMHFAGVPGLPYLGDVQRAMTTIYNEDPVVIRKRQRETLAGYGLSAEEVARFENTLLLSPTRQAVLSEDARLMDGVAGRDELFRHAMAVTSTEEVQVFIQSCRLLTQIHARHPLAAIIPGLRIPAARSADGHVIVAGAFDAVYWTEDVAGYQRDLQAVLPADGTVIEVWLSGAASPRVRTELQARGWQLHDHAAEVLTGTGAPAAQ